MSTLDYLKVAVICWILGRGLSWLWQQMAKADESVVLTGRLPRWLILLRAVDFGLHLLAIAYFICFVLKFKVPA